MFGLSLTSTVNKEKAVMRDHYERVANENYTLKKQVAIYENMISQHFSKNGFDKDGCQRRQLKVKPKKVD